MKKQIKILMLALLILILVCLILIGLNKNKKNNNENIASQEEVKVYNQNKQKYECNEFKLVNITAESLILTYFNSYRENVLKNPHIAYEQLNSEYREKKFNTVENYLEYINKNYSNIGHIKIKSYKVNNFDDCSEYLCIDEDNNYYIFQETATMQFTILLDEYTINTEDFKKRYNETNNHGKIALNTDKFFEAINDSDYEFAYNCLSQGFKDNYFKTLEEFEKYVNDNFYKINSIEYESGDLKTESGIYKYKINITNADNTEENTEKTVIMKLNEGTNFEMSFNIN